jgi:hypothetical protein
VAKFCIDLQEFLQGASPSILKTGVVKFQFDPSSDSNADQSIVIGVFGKNLKPEERQFNEVKSFIENIQDEANNKVILTEALFKAFNFSLMWINNYIKISDCPTTSNPTSMSGIRFAETEKEDPMISISCSLRYPACTFKELNRAFSKLDVYTSLASTHFEKCDLLCGSFANLSRIKPSMIL